ncbi:hypothetical protein T265_04173 [Opisthorchis viverrini]|uniref:Uncharacterized protein n=1 Tax=Opisthorchis viverrini TaxID=6198 RepID=A0A075AGX8_OPIVI|nr:hypothetical protein T265_04173 [Opisthorchis viverrini]KER29169.1 hypothetical protein T265_04173 [Opisthorchis viverrini]
MQQAGFRPGRGCIDQIFTLRQVLEQRHTYKRPTILVFLDFRGAFDSVDRSVLLETLAHQGMPRNKFMRTFEMISQHHLLTIPQYVVRRSKRIKQFWTEDEHGKPLGRLTTVTIKIEEPCEYVLATRSVPTPSALRISYAVERPLETVDRG